MADPGEHVSAADPGANAAASAAAFLDEAREKIKAGDVPAALICLRTVAGLAGCPPESLIDAAKLLAQNGDSESAINAYIQAGNAYLGQRKEYQKARQAFQAAHALDVHNLDVIYMLGQADVEDGRLQDGLAKFIDVLRKSNLKHVQALFAAGCIYQQNGQFDQAMLAFKKVLDRDKDHVQATVRIGQLYQSKELMTDAIGYYIQAAQLARECQHWSSARQIATMVLAIDAQNQKARILLDELDEQGHGADEVGVGEPPIAGPIGPAIAAAGQRVGAQAANAAKAAAANKVLQAPPATAAQKPSATPVPARGAEKEVKTPAAVSAGKQQPQAPQAQPTAKPAAPLLAAQVAAKQSPQRPEAASPGKPEPAVASAAPAPAPAHAETAAGSADVERARQMLAAIEAQRQAAQQDLQLLLQTRGELQKALAEQRTLLETATMRKSDLEVQLTTAQAKLEAAKSAGAEAVAQSGDDKQQMTALAAERVALETALQALKAEAAELGARKAAEESALREITGLRDQTSAEVAALTAKMQDAKKLTDELEAIRTAAGDAEAQAAQAQTISAELIALEDKRSKLQDEVAAAEQTLASLRAEIEQAKADAGAAKADAEQATADAAQAAHARDKARAEADELAARVQQLSSSGTGPTHAAPADVAARATDSPPPPGSGGGQSAHARAAAQLAAGEYEKAAASYRQALEENPQDAAAAYQAGAILAEHGGDLEAAERLLSQAAELRPEHAATRYELALVRARRGNVVEGADMLTALVRADANNADFVDQFVERMEKDMADGSVAAKYRLGLAYRELGRIEEALVALQAIQHEQEMVVPCLIAIGSCLRRQGLDGAAAKRFAKAIETPGYAEPLYLEALYNLGDLYEAKGTQESLALALSSFEELYARDLTYRDIGERVRVVKANLSSAERQKVKRLPTRVADSQGNQ